MGTLYNPTLLDHFEHPRNAGDLPGATAQVEVSNPVCGDVLRLAARFERGQVQEARFKTQGCVASIAASSWLTDWMRGKSADDLGKLTPENVAEGLGGLAPASSHAADLACDALRLLLSRL